MSFNKYLYLSHDKLFDQENKYHYMPHEFEIKNTGLSYNRSCLKETVRIAKLRQKNLFRQIAVSEKLLAKKRLADIRRLNTASKTNINHSERL